MSGKDIVAHSTNPCHKMSHMKWRFFFGMFCFAFNCFFFRRMLLPAYVKLAKFATWANSAFMSLYTLNSPNSHCGPSMGPPAHDAADDAAGTLASMFQGVLEFSKLRRSRILPATFRRMLCGAYMKLAKLETCVKSAFMSLYTADSRTSGPSRAHLLTTLHGI